MRTSFLVAVFSLAASAQAADKVTLEESTSDARTYAVSQAMRLTGTLSAPRPMAEPLKLKMNARASHAFVERRLPGRGRDAKALRALREYRYAKTETAIGSNHRSKKLADDRLRIVMQADDAGLTPWSPKGVLSFSDVELLQMPCDVLAVRGLLPPVAVAVGETWTPNSWALELLTGLDAVAKPAVKCKLDSADGTTAVVSIEGTLEGARDGAPTKLKLAGEFRFDRKRNFVSTVTFKQTEKSQPGPLSPALDIVATVTIARKPAADSQRLSDKLIKSIPLEPEGRLLGAKFTPTIGSSFVLSRGWHVVFDNREIAILRLLDRGNLIAQVNIKPLEKAAPGKHLSEREFQDSVRKTLGPELTAIVRAEQVKSKETGDKRFLYRVVADGSSNGKEMRWIYAICAAADGRQMTLVFAVEKKLIKQFGDRDVGFLLSAEFPANTK